MLQKNSITIISRRKSRRAEEREAISFDCRIRFPRGNYLDIGVKGGVANLAQAQHPRKVHTLVHS